MIEYAANGDSQALFHVIEADDRVLLGSSENTWYSALYFFAWETIRELGADYYTSLSDFNRKQAVRRWEGRSVAGLMNNPLSRSDAEIEKLRDTLKNEFGITLKTTVNPGRRLPVTDDLPKGIASISPYGTVTCNGAYELDYRGRRKEDQAYVFTAPVTDEGKPVCETCPLKSACCNNTNTAGRRVQLSWDFFPSINPDDPQIAHRFKQTMKKRPAVERMIKRLKCDLSSPYLTKRGNKAFQAYLDKTMMAYHILLRLQN